MMTSRAQSSSFNTGANVYKSGLIAYLFHWQLLSITDILLTVSVIGITKPVALAHARRLRAITCIWSA